MTQQLSKPSTAGAGAYARIRGWMLLLGPAMGLAAALLALRSGSEVALAVTVAVTVCCATWWIFEPVPAPITAPIARPMRSRVPSVRFMPLPPAVSGTSSAIGLRAHSDRIMPHPP